MALPPRDLASVVGREDDPQLTEGIEPASLTSMITRKATGAILEPLTKRGARIDPEAKVIEPKVKRIDEPVEEVAPPEITEPAPEDITPQPVEVAPEEPQIVKPAPATEEAVQEAMDARQEAMGGPRTVPSPATAAARPEVIEGPVNTRFYDSDSLAATVQAVAGQKDPNYKSRTVQSFFDRAIMAGVPKAKLDQIFKGIPMTSKVGDNALATQMAGLQVLHDVSAQRLDELMTQAASGLLTDSGKFELREALSQHQIIVSQLRGAKTDVARAMNTFKGARERNLPSLDIRAVLDGMGGDDQLRVMAENYIKADTRAGKNKIIEAGILRKSYESIIYMAQSVFLSNIDTHIYNAAANTAHLVLDVPERAAAIPVGILRQRLAKSLGIEYNPDRYYGQDIYARTSGFYNGLMDGFSLMAHGAKTGAAKDAPRNPVSSEYFSNTPVRILGKEIGRTPELKNSLPGAILDVLGTIYSMPMKALAAGDELIGGIAQRIELHEQAWRLGAKVFDDAVGEGLSEEDALKRAQNEVTKLLSERPHDVEASMQGFRKQITLLSDVDRTSSLGRTYAGALKIMNWPLIKPIALFSKSVTNLAIEGAARLPVLNFVSPRFYSEWQKGGRHRDLAISRMALGSGMALGSYYLAYNGRTTGAGPSDTEDRKALQAGGWQEFSLVFGEDELDSLTVSRIKELLGEDAVSQGTGSHKGKLFVSFKRLEPATIPFLLGAAYADAVKYRAYDPDDTQLQIMTDAAMAALAEYSTNQPAMQSFNEIMRIANQKQTDGGERLLAVLDAYARQVVNVGYAGTPVVGLANSALVAKIERIIDPKASQTAVTKDQVEWADDVMGIDAQAPGIRAFFEAYNKLMSRVPVMSKGVLPRLDERGRPMGTNFEHVWTPLRMIRGERDEVSEVLVALNHGIGYPDFSISGVQLTAEQQNKYLKLQQEEYNGMTMDDAILNAISTALDDAEITGVVPGIGMLQSEIDSVVAEYRERAREKMFGIKRKDESGMYSFTDTDREGNPVLYPETAREMAWNDTKRLTLYGR